MNSEPAPVRFGPDGLIPAVIQDAAAGSVLMVGFMNAEALAATRATGRTHFWSRSRGKLWRKGETSGHEQFVEAIYVNCEQNSLLVTVRQIGAVCHDGYPTCFYRRLEPDNALTITQERAFDPGVVYGNPAASPAATDLAAATRQLYGAYEFLRQHDLAAVSGTSRHLRAVADTVSRRVADELGELAGVLDGTHQHDSFDHDVRLEATQVLYWVVLAAIRDDLSWATLRPDQALAQPGPKLDHAGVAGQLRAESARWSAAAAEDRLTRCHAVLTLIAAICQAASIAPAELVAADLAALRAKPYLAPYFGVE